MSQRNQLFCVLLECWNDVLPGALERKSLGSKRLVTRQVKRLVLSGVIPTIQQQRELCFRLRAASEASTC